MKNIFLIISLLISIYANGQTAYRDAIYLKEFSSGVNSKTNKAKLNGAADDVGNILGTYFPGATDITEIDISTNPFIEIENTPQNGSIEKRLDLVGSVSGLPVTTFADGLAQFLIDRAMQELDVAFFSRFKDFLVKTPEARILFPTTTDYITNFSPHEYPIFIVSLRESFYNDLKNLTYNVDDVFLLPKYIELIDAHPEIIISINCIQLIVDLEDGTHPVDVIEKFKNLEAWSKYGPAVDNKPALKNLHSGLKTSHMLANSVRGVGSDPLRTWISVQDFRTNILDDSTAFKIFLGLIYQQAKNDEIKFTYKKDETDRTILFTDFLDKNKQRLITFQSLFLELIQKGTLVDESITEIIETTNKNEMPTKENYYKYINSSIDIIEFGFKVSSLVADKDSDDTYGTYLNIARQGNNLYRNVYHQQYAAAVLNASSIFESTFTEIENQNHITKDLEIIRDILRYGTFMANVIEAEGPSQVKVAIEAAVLPVGSSTVKKYYRDNFSINSYIGGFVRNKANNIQQSWDARVGFTAPVGFAYTPLSWGKGGSLSVFVPLIDVGAIAQFRISDDNSEIEEDISLGNIFSPGGYLVYGMASNLPISIGIGGQHGPGLVSFDPNTSNVVNPSWRWNIFLAVDIPLFNLSKGKRLKQ